MTPLSKVTQPVMEDPELGYLPLWFPYRGCSSQLVNQG